MKNNRLNILVSGSLAIDRIMDFPGYFRDHILPDKIHNLNVAFNITELRENFGGTAGNIAYNLAILGERPIVLATAGADFEAYKRWLAEPAGMPFSCCGTRPAIGRGSDSPRFKNDIPTGSLEKKKTDGSFINLSQVKIVKNKPTASAYIITDKDDNQITGFNMGAMSVSLGKFNEKLLKNSLAIISPGNILDMENYARLYQKKKVKYIFDPGQAMTALSKEVLKMASEGAEIVIGNDYEIELLKKRTGWTEDKLLDKVKRLIITKGDKGSEIYTPIPNLQIISSVSASVSLDGQIHKYSGRKKIVIKAVKAERLADPTGAGDAYRAGLLKGLILGWELEKCARLASTVASYAVEKYGTQNHVYNWRDLAKRYRKSYGKNLI